MGVTVVRCISLLLMYPCYSGSQLCVVASFDLMAKVGGDTGETFKLKGCVATNSGFLCIFLLSALCYKLCRRDPNAMAMSLM